MNSTSLEAAFCATIYRVDLPGACIDLHIGLESPAFDAFLRAQGASCWAILTACNPQAVRLSNEANQRHQARLLVRLAELGWLFFAACNLADAGDWPAEPGCLILQVNEEELRALAVEFSQRAMVYGETGSPPRLLWI